MSCFNVCNQRVKGDGAGITLDARRCPALLAGMGPRRRGGSSDLGKALLSSLLLLCVLMTGPLHAGQVRTAGGETLVGRVSLDDEQTLTVTPPDDAAAYAGATVEPVTEARSVELIDVDEVRFGDVAMRGDGRPVVSVGGANRDREASETVRLRAGAHRIVLAYAHVGGPASLELTWVNAADPTGDGAELPTFGRLGSTAEDPAPAGYDHEGWRLPEDPEGLRSRLGYTYYTFEPEQAERAGLGPVERWGLAEPFSIAERKRSGSTSRIDLRLSGRDHHYALLFDGYLRVPTDRELTVKLTADSPAALYLGAMPGFAEHAGESAGASGAGLDAADWLVSFVGTGAAGGPSGAGAPADGGRVSLSAWTDGRLELTTQAGAGEAMELTVPTERVGSLWSIDAAAAALERTGEPTDADSVYVADREGGVQRLTAEVIGIEAPPPTDAGHAAERQLVLRYDGRERRIDLARVRGIVFAPDRRDRSDQADFHQVLEFVIGPALPGRWTGGGGNDPLTFETSWGQSVTAPVDAVSRLRTINGRLVRLTDLDPAVEEVPYFDRVMPHRIDAALDGEPILLFDGRRYDTGISTHSLSRLTYGLGGDFARLRSKVGLLKPGGELGNVTLRVLGDGSPLFERSNVTADAGVIDLDLDVTGVDRLTLETDFGQGQDVGDRVGWVDPVLVRPWGEQ